MAGACTAHISYVASRNSGKLTLAAACVGQANKTERGVVIWFTFDDGSRLSYMPQVPGDDGLEDMFVWQGIPEI
jgi:hypothetical protein